MEHILALWIILSILFTVYMQQPTAFGCYKGGCPKMGAYLILPNSTCAAGEVYCGSFHEVRNGVIQIHN